MGPIGQHVVQRFFGISVAFVGLLFWHWSFVTYICEFHPRALLATLDHFCWRLTFCLIEIIVMLIIPAENDGTRLPFWKKKPQLLDFLVSTRSLVGFNSVC